MNDEAQHIKEYNETLRSAIGIFKQRRLNADPGEEWTRAENLVKEKAENLKESLRKVFQEAVGIESNKPAIAK